MTNANRLFQTTVRGFRAYAIRPYGGGLLGFCRGAMLAPLPIQLRLHQPTQSQTAPPLPPDARF